MRDVFWLITAWYFCTLFVHSRTSYSQESPASLSGFTESEIFDIQDEKPLDLTQPISQRLSYRAENTPHHQLEKFAQLNRSLTIQEITEQPNDFRCYVIPLSGRVVHFKLFRIPESEDTNASHMAILYCRDSSGNEFVLVTLKKHIPSRWRPATKMDESIRSLAFFSAIHEFEKPNAATESSKISWYEDTEKLAPVFFGHELIWQPIRTNNLYEISPAEILLAQHQVNIGEIDLLRQNINGPIQKSQSNLFYQLLGACNAIDPMDLPSHAGPALSDLLKNPTSHAGCLVKWNAVVKRVTEVDCPANIDRMKNSIYYQLDMFILLDNQKIVIQNPNGAGLPEIVHENRFPVTVCTPSIPTEQAKLEGQLVEFTGFFFKLWNYDSELTEMDTRLPKQISPLIIALEPTMVSSNISTSSWIAIVSAGLLLFIGWLFWALGFFHQQEQPIWLERELPDKISEPSIED
ncbi:MAG: hypothetical protein AAGA30_01515 [Planctomycetota bacterium]